MKDVLWPSSLIAVLFKGSVTALSLIGDVATEHEGTLKLVKEFGTWIIWLIIAFYLFKRGEKRDEEDRKERKAVEEARLATQVKYSDDIKLLLTQSTEAINNNSKQFRELSRRMKGKACMVLSPPPEHDDDHE